MNKQQREDLDRTNELLTRIWGTVIKNKYRNKPNPDEITINQIESHQGRIQKAIKLLGRNIKYIGEQKVTTSRSIKMYKVLNLDQSKQFAKEPGFFDVIKLIHNTLFPINYDNQHDMDTLCYEHLLDMKGEHVIYVYWNEKEFDIVRGDDRNDIRIYLRASLDKRMKAIMRSLVEHYVHSFFHNHIEDCLGLRSGAIKTEDHFSPKIRNFAAYGHRFTMEKFYGKNGFLDEYTHFRDYFQALIDHMKDFQTHIDKAGGHAAIIEQYRKEIIASLLKKAPLAAFSTLPKKEAYQATSIADQYKNPYLNAFILKNAQYLNYDVLYSDDKDILYIDQNGRCSFAEDTTFQPKFDELELIAGKE